MLLAALLAVQQAPAQPATWATDQREPLCVFDGLQASASAAEAGSRARSDAVKNECRQRFGWTEAQADEGHLVSMLTADALHARDEALAAGVSIEAIGAMVESFSVAERDLMPRSGPISEENSRQFALLLRQRTMAQGLQGEQATKAANAVMQLLSAMRELDDFSREVRGRPWR